MMSFDDLLAIGKADPIAGVLLFGVKPLKDLENPHEILLFYSDAIVRDGEFPESLFFHRRDMDLWRDFTLAVFYGVTQQVRQEYNHLILIGDDLRQRRRGYLGAGIGDYEPEIFRCTVEDILHIDDGEGLRCSRDTGESEQVVDEGLEPFGTADSPGDKIITLLIDFVGVPLLHELKVARYDA